MSAPDSNFERRKKLADHEKSLAKTLEMDDSDFKSEEERDQFIESVLNHKGLNIYSGVATNIYRRFQINDKQHSEVIDFLERSAIVYVGANKYTEFAKEHQKNLKKLRKISKLASEIQYIICQENSNLMMVLKGSDLATKYAGDNFEHHKLLEELLKQLEQVQQIPNELESSAYGKKLKLGQRAKRGNVRLNDWVTSLIFLWEKLLKRSVGKKSSQYDGRTNFIGFMTECMDHLDENIEADSLIYVFDRIIKSRKSGKDSNQTDLLQK